MIRFVDLGDQISGVNEFAFYNTITDVFVEFEGNYTWDCKACLKYDMEDFIKNYGEEEASRYINKVTDKFPNKCKEYDTWLDQIKNH